MGFVRLCGVEVTPQPARNFSLNWGVWVRTHPYTPIYGISPRQPKHCRERAILNDLVKDKIGYPFRMPGKTTGLPIPRVTSAIMPMARLIHAAICIMNRAP